MVFAQEEDLYNLENTRKFADYLYKSGQYQLAVNEYERALFLNPSNDTLKYLLVQSISEQGKPLQAIERTNNLFEARDLPTNMAKVQAHNLFLIKDFKQLNDLVKKNAYLSDEDKLAAAAYTELWQLDWNAATPMIQQLEILGYSNTPDLQDLLKRGQSLRYKSPALAVGLSALVPGLGKAYVGDWKDGLISLIIVSGTAWQSYRSFKRKGSDNFGGWFLGAVSIGFYGGNILGTNKAAKKYNNKLNGVIQHETEHHFLGHF